MKIRGVDYIFYNVTDMKKSLPFYRDILGMKLSGEAGDTWAEFDLGNMTLAIGVFGAEPMGPKANKNNVCGALAVDDVKEALTYLRGKGVEVAMDFHESKPCFMAIILDPDRNQILLHQRKDGTVGQ